jgi:hypothetical protein
VGPLSGSRTALQEARTIRNAIAHDSGDARQKFETLVRDKLVALPTGMTVGAFLGTVISTSSPPQTFLEFYVARIELVVSQIVPH